MGESAISAESLVFIGIFLGLPPVLLAVRFFRRKPAWWLIVLLIGCGGWAAWVLSVVTHFEHLQDLVESTDNPDPDLLDRAYSDGAPLVFAAFLGWLISLAYAVPWWVLFLVATWLRTLARRLRRTER